MNITFWVGLAIGLIIGWIIEWLLDFFFWRRQKSGLSAAAEADFKAQIKTLEVENARLKTQADTAEKAQFNLAACETERSELTALVNTLEAENENLKASIEAIEAENERIQRAGGSALIATAEDTVISPQVSGSAPIATTEDTVISPRKDPLVDVIGIGPVFQRRLYEAGITTFAQLADTPADEILRIVQAKEWQAIDADEWRDEARKLATAAPSLPPGYDPLVDINGIGPKYAEQLYAAGIVTFAQVAACTPAQLDEIITQESFQKVDFAGWIAEAKRRAQGQ